MLIQGVNRSGLFKWIDDISDQKIDNLQGSSMTAELISGITLSVRYYGKGIACSLYTEFDNKRVWCFQDAKDLKNIKTGLFEQITLTVLSKLLAEDQEFLAHRMIAIAQAQAKLFANATPTSMADENMTEQQRRDFWRSGNAG